MACHIGEFSPSALSWHKGGIPSLELPPGHAGVGVRGGGELDRLLAHAITSGSPEVIITPQ